MKAYEQSVRIWSVAISLYVLCFHLNQCAQQHWRWRFRSKANTNSANFSNTYANISIGKYDYSLHTTWALGEQCPHTRSLVHSHASGNKIKHYDIAIINNFERKAQFTVIFSVRSVRNEGNVNAMLELCEMWAMRQRIESWSFIFHSFFHPLSWPHFQKKNAQISNRTVSKNKRFLPSSQHSLQAKVYVHIKKYVIWNLFVRLTHGC